MQYLRTIIISFKFMTIYFKIKRVHITDLILTIENVEQEDRYDSGGDGGQVHEDPGHVLQRPGQSAQEP